MQLPRTTQIPADDSALLVEIFENSPSFIAILTGKDHVFELVNKAYYQLVGHRDILGMPVLLAIPEVIGQGYIELLDSVYQTGTPFIGTEMRIQLQVTPSTPTVECYVNFVYQARRNVDGEIIGIFAHGVDVTDLVLARQESEERAHQLKQQAQAFDTTLTNIIDFVYTFDRDGRFTYCNKPLLDLLCISLEDIIGKNFHDLGYPHELAVTLQAYITQVVETRKQVHDETRFVSPTGKVGYYEYIFTPVFGEDGEVVVIAGSTRDITERVLQERQKDEFLSIVSHELKTPVTSIKAYAQILQKRLAREGNMEVVAHLIKMEVQINKLITLINDLLDVTQLRNGIVRFHNADFAFDDIVTEAIEEVQRISEDHTITRVGTTNQIVYGDRERIGQVLINLLTNAIKYSPHADTILVTSTTDAATVTLSVQDFGIGINPEQMPHIFERFYRVGDEEHTTIPGLGIGLYVSSEIIKRHGGTVTVESHKNHGSTFSFSLSRVITEQQPPPHSDDAETQMLYQ